MRRLSPSHASVTSRRMGGAKRYPSPRARGIDGYRFAPPILRRRTFAISRRIAPEACISFALLKQRAQGRPGARCTRGLACNCAQRTRTRAYRFSGNIRPSLRSGFTAYIVLSPVNGSFATVAAQELNLQDLTPAPRRQDHTTSPYASCHTRQPRNLASTASHRTFVTIAIAPHWVRRAELCR